MRGAGTERSTLVSPFGRAGAQRPRLPLWGSWHGEAVTEEAFPAVRGTPPATAWPSPLINAGGKNGAQHPWLSLWESWHGEAVTERAVPAAAGGGTPPAAAWPSPLINAGGKACRSAVPLIRGIPTPLNNCPGMARLFGVYVKFQFTLILREADTAAVRS